MSNPATQNEDDKDIDNITEKNKRVKMEQSNPVVQDTKPNSKLAPGTVMFL